MGNNINCSQFCQGAERSTELDLKRSILQTFVQARNSIETMETIRRPTKPQMEQTHQSNKPSESTIPDSKQDSFTISIQQQRENAARLIQNCWKINFYTKQYTQYKNYRKPNSEYFSYEYNKETASPANGFLKRKKKTTFTYPNGATYKGEWAGGFRDGNGVMNWPDGSIYQGRWSYGYPFGEGLFTFKGGKTFDGE